MGGSAGTGAARGRFVVLDGVDGCGKSTQAARLAAALAAEPGRPEPLHLREPGSTPVGERIRSLLLDPALAIGAPSEALLFVAARREMLDRLVEPALAAGRDVVCERFHASTYAYQAVAGALDEEELLRLLSVWAGRPAPDLTVVLDLAPELAEARRGPAGDRIEARDADFHRAVARGYRRYVERDPRAVLVDASGTPEDVAARVLTRVRALAAGEVR